MSQAQQKIKATDDALDAERYRYLKAHSKVFGLDITGRHSWICVASPAKLIGPTFDAAVDTAIEECRKQRTASDTRGTP
jgi:hypothetical protein